MRAVMMLNLHFTDGCWTTWLNRAPLNLDTHLLGFPSTLGCAEAYLTVACLANLAVLAGLLWLFARYEVDYSAYLYAYAAISVGDLLLSIALGLFLHAFALLPVILLTAWILARLCGVSARRALIVALVFHSYQLAYIVAYKFIEAKVAV